MKLSCAAVSIIRSSNEFLEPFWGKLFVLIVIFIQKNSQVTQNILFQLENGPDQAVCCALYTSKLMG